LQNDKKLREENYFLKWISDRITECRKDGYMSFTKDFKDFEGNLTIEGNYEK
jgi:hypothetical protein